MTRKELEEMGLSKENIDTIMKINGEDIENAKTTVKESFKDVQTEIKGLKDAVNDRDKQLEDIKKSSGDNETLKQQIADMQKNNADTIKAKDDEIAKIKLNNAVDKALGTAKAKNSKAVMALLNLEGAEVDENGLVKGLDEQLKALQGDDSTSFLFDMEDVKTGPSIKGATPATSGQPQTTKIDLENMSYAEFTKYAEVHPEVLTN